MSTVFITQLKPSLVDASLTLAVLVLLLDLSVLRTAVLIVQGHTSVMEDSACSAYRYTIVCSYIARYNYIYSIFATIFTGKNCISLVAFCCLNNA